MDLGSLMGFTVLDRSEELLGFMPTWPAEDPRRGWWRRVMATCDARVAGASPWTRLRWWLRRTTPTAMRMRCRADALQHPIWRT